MNDKNYEYLTGQLRGFGYGDTLNNELKKNMQQQNADFTLNIQQAYGSDKVSATLYFKKSEESERFFFNKYDIELQKENQKDAIKQTFYPDKNITLKEGYNLLDGRAVHKTLSTKEDEKYTAWLQLDFSKTRESGNYEFKQYHQNWGFDLEKTLSKYPIKELENEKYKSSLVRSIERGNLQSATFKIDGKEEKIYLSALPGFKAMSAFDSEMKRIKLSELLPKQTQEQSVVNDQKQAMVNKQDTKKEAVGTDEKQKPVQKKSKTQKIT